MFWYLGEWLPRGPTLPTPSSSALRGVNSPLGLALLLLPLFAACSGDGGGYAYAEETEIEYTDLDGSMEGPRHTLPIAQRRVLLDIISRPAIRQEEGEGSISLTPPLGFVYVRDKVFERYEEHLELPLGSEVCLVWHDLRLAAFPKMVTPGAKQRGKKTAEAEPDQQSLESLLERQ